MRNPNIFAGMAISILLTVCSGNAAAKETPHADLAVSSWIGYAPLFVAKEAGFFEQRGVDVEFHRIEKVSSRRSALAAGRIDGFSTTVDSWVTTVAAGVDAVQVLALDDSYGADGVVAKNEIKKIEDLKGKKVGLETGGGASFFWFLYLLNQHDMSLDDIKVQNLSAGDAGSAFAAGRLPAGVTWEPWLTNATKTDFGHVLVTSRETPGVIADTLGFNRDYVNNNPKAVQGIVDAWFDALDYIDSNQKKAYAIMAKSMNQTPEEFAGVVDGVRWYDRDKNIQYFGSQSNPGDLMELLDQAVKLYNQYDVIDSEPDMSQAIDSQFVQSQ